MEKQKEPDINKVILDTSPQKSHKIIKYIAMGVFILLPFVGFYLGTLYERSQNSTHTPIDVSNNQPQVSPVVTPEITQTVISQPVPSISTNPTTTAISVVDGASLENIQYTLPDTWAAELSYTTLLLSASGGGYLSISVHEYSGVLVRRAFYCTVVEYCIPETYYIPMIIGNISGYRAVALDNSGGGSDYFGSKGNKFYLINSYGPLEGDNEYTRRYQSVLDSLVF